MGDVIKNEVQKKCDILREVSARWVARSEPMRVMQGLKFDMMIMRAELMSFRDELKEPTYNETRHQDKFAVNIEKFTQIMCEVLGFAITDDGRIIEGVKSEAIYNKANEGSILGRKS